MMPVRWSYESSTPSLSHISFGIPVAAKKSSTRYKLAQLATLFPPSACQIEFHTSAPAPTRSFQGNELPSLSKSSARICHRRNPSSCQVIPVPLSTRRIVLHSHLSSVSVSAVSSNVTTSGVALESRLWKRTHCALSQAVGHSKVLSAYPSNTTSTAASSCRFS